MLRLKNSKPGKFKPPKRAQNPVVKFIRNTVISVTVLLVLFIGGAILYTWYMGQHATTETAASAPVTDSHPILHPTQPKPDAVVGAAVQFITSPVAPGSNMSMTIHTNPAAKCTIAVQYGDTKSKDSGLMAKVADEYGLVSWTWTVDQAAPLGKGVATATCANIKNSGMVEGNFVIAKTTAAN